MHMPKSMRYLFCLSNMENDWLNPVLKNVAHLHVLDGCLDMGLNMKEENLLLLFSIYFTP